MGKDWPQPRETSLHNDLIRSAVIYAELSSPNYGYVSLDRIGTRLQVFSSKSWTDQ